MEKSSANRCCSERSVEFRRFGKEQTSSVGRPMRSKHSCLVVERALMLAAQAELNAPLSLFKRQLLQPQLREIRSAPHPAAPSTPRGSTHCCQSERRKGCKTKERKMRNNGGKRAGLATKLACFLTDLREKRDICSELHQ